MGLRKAKEKEGSRYASSSESLWYRLTTYFFVLTKPVLATGIILTVIGYTAETIDVVRSFQILGPVLIGLSACFFLFCGTLITPQYVKCCSSPKCCNIKQKTKKTNEVIDKAKDSETEPPIQSPIREETLRVIVVTPQGSGSPALLSKPCRVEPLTVDRDFGNVNTAFYPREEGNA